MAMEFDISRKNTGEEAILVISIEACDGINTERLTASKHRSISYLRTQDCVCIRQGSGKTNKLNKTAGDNGLLSNAALTIISIPIFLSHFSRSIGISCNKLVEFVVLHIDV